MEVFFLLERFFPDITASGNLLMNLLEEFSEKFKVNILCTSDKDSSEKYREVEVKRFEKKIIQSRFIIKKFKYDVVINEEMKEYLEKKISKSENPALLIPVTISELKLAILLKKKFNDKVLLMPFLLEIIPVQYTDAKFIKNELLQFADEIFILPKLKTYFESNNNINIVEHPMVINNVGNISEKSDIHLTYIGGLDRRNRNPKKIVEMIEIINDETIFFDFYGYGNMDRYLKKKSNTIKNFNFYGTIDSVEAKNILRDSSILITIGNKNSNLVPSKLFDYISTGNPIIHFYQNDDDPYLEYLEKYKYSLCVNYFDIDKYKIIEFIKANHNKKISFEEIEETFKICTPNYVFSQFYNKVKKYEE